MSTERLRVALRKRCAAPQWCLLEEVRESVGHGSKRSADAIAMSTWEGRGLELHGFELKASRSDWLRELKDPEKAEPLTRYCDRWWVVAADAGIVRDGELPPGWGLLVLRGSVLQTAVGAPKRESVSSPDRPFLAALLRRAAEQFAERIPQDEVDARVRAGVEETVARRDADPDRKALETRAVLLDNLEAKLGFRVYGIGNIDAIVRAHALIKEADGLRWKLNALERAAEAGASIAKELRVAIKTIRAAESDERGEKSCA